MRRKSLLRILTILLIITIMPISAFAIFTDLEEASWAKGYIETMAEEGIVTGYDDNTFRPNDNISKYASVLMIYRTLKASDLVTAAEQTANINKHMSTIIAKGVPNWPDLYGAVAFCLEKGIIASDDLNNFHIGDTYTNARRFEVAVFLGKAMNLYLEEDLNILYTLNFKDAASIVTAARPYVYLLNKHDVISGDTLGYFNPSDPITRAAMAKMLAVSLDILKEKTPAEEDAAGTITNIIGDTNRVVIQRGADEDDIAIYNLTDVDIVIGGKEGDIEDLEIDMAVRMTFEGTLLTKLTVVDGTAADSAVYDYDATYYGYMAFEDYYLVTLKDHDGDKFTYKTTPTVVIRWEGAVADFDDFERGDPVDYTLSGSTFTRIEGFDMSREFEGIFQEYKEGDDGDTIVITKSGGGSLELALDDSYDVEKNGNDRSISNLYKGDFVVVTTEYEKVVLIVASSNETEESGIIRSILIAAQPRITVMTEDNEEKTFDIDENVDIEIGGDEGSLYDLRLNYSVDIVIEGGVATGIEADSYAVLNKIDGSIYGIYISSEKLKVKYLKDGVNEYIYVYIDVDDTDIFSPEGRSMDFEDLDEDDKVFIYGSYEGTNFMADKIFVLE